MLVTLKDILATAQERGIAVGAFNAANLESLEGIIAAAEELELPVILQFAQVHEPWIRLRLIGPGMVRAAGEARVPVCVHLDHGEDMDYLKEALDMGFTGIMYDGSVLPYEENLTNTRKAVEMASRYGAGVEAELGSMGRRESGAGDGSGEGDETKIYTDPDQAAAFVRETGIDALAPSFGTAHGIYKAKPVLDLDRVKVISERTGLPLVMHGGSGVAPDEYRRGIANGLRKINYYTYMSREGTNAVKKMLAEEEVTFYHDLALAAQKAMEADAEKAMRVFAGI
jgi:fructose-bisphosphate aldolase class II